MKMEKNYDVLTFMSWNEEDLDGSSIRAIALCDDTGLFYEAINAPRDGQMGKKDENGVYDRIWWGDYIENGCDVKDVRPATKEEVDLYLKYCPIENRRDMIDDEHVVTIISQPTYTIVVVCYYTTIAIWLRRMKKSLHEKCWHYKYLIKYRLWNRK